MTDEFQVQNRMAEKPELDMLRASSEKPSWWTRTRHSLAGSLKNSTTITILLAVSILLVIAAAALFGT